MVHTIKIGNFEYIKDDTNSYHRVLSNKERDTVFDYKQYIYIDGNFEDEDSLAKISNKELYIKFQNDVQKSNKSFEVLENWGLIPAHNSNILDLGCGYGMFINQWITKGYGKGYGIDISPLVKRISPVSDNIQIIDLNSICDIPISPNISLIIASDIIEHLFDVTHVLNVISSKIKFGIQMFIEIPIISHNSDEIQLMSYKYLYPTRHLHLFTQQGIKQKLTKSGFQIIQSKLINDKYLILVEKWKN